MMNESKIFYDAKVFELTICSDIQDALLGTLTGMYTGQKDFSFKSMSDRDDFKKRLAGLSVKNKLYIAFTEREKFERHYYSLPEGATVTNLYVVKYLGQEYTTTGLESVGEALDICRDRASPPDLMELSKKLSEMRNQAKKGRDAQPFYGLNPKDYEL